MTFGLITSWQIEKEKVETVTDFLLLGSKITVDDDCRHDIKRLLFLGRKAVASLESILKNRDITLPTKVHIVKAMAFPKAFDYADHNKLWKILKEMGIPDHLTDLPLEKSVCRSGSNS